MLRPYRSFFSISLSSWRLLLIAEVRFPSWTVLKASRLDPDENRAVGDWLTGVEVKHVFGLERGRSALTGVGLILLDGLLLLKKWEEILLKPPKQQNSYPKGKGKSPGRPGLVEDQTEHGHWPTTLSITALHKWSCTLTFITRIHRTSAKKLFSLASIKLKNLPGLLFITNCYCIKQEMWRAKIMLTC